MSLLQEINTREVGLQNQHTNADSVNVLHKPAAAMLILRNQALSVQSVSTNISTETDV